MSEMIDKVAAVLEQCFKDRIAAHASAAFDSTGVVSPKPEVWQAYARAAVLAMRKPTKAMVESNDAAAYVANDEYNIGPGHLWNVWITMIDEALK